MVATIPNLLYQEVVYFLKLHIYWLENIITFTGPSQKNTLSSVSMLQPKALHFHYLILKVTCFLHLFGLPWKAIFLLQDQFNYLFYQVCVKKMVLLIFQLTFIQDSQMIILPQVHTIVALFLDMNICVQLLQIIATCANTINERLHQTLKPVVWIYASRMIQIFLIPLISVRWLKFYVHLKSILNGISSSHLPVTWEMFLVQNQLANG